MTPELARGRVRLLSWCSGHGVGIQETHQDSLKGTGNCGWGNVTSRDRVGCVEPTELMNAVHLLSGFRSGHLMLREL